MRRRSALILLNGRLGSASAARAAARTADWVICADGGARHARALGIAPDFVVGDMDSCPGRLRRSWPRASFVEIPDQGRSDLEKALDLARRLEVGRVVVAGAWGGVDHELVNVAVLERAKGLEVAVIGRGRAFLLGPGRRRLPTRKGDRLTLLAAPRARLSLSGARFVLRDELLVRGSRGLGNRAEGPASIRVRSGRVWAILPA